MQKSFLILLAIVSLLSSCKKENTGEDALLTLKMGELYPAPYHIVISDENGTILNSATFNANETLEIMPLEPFKGKSINVVYYVYYGGFTSITGYVHVKRGSDFEMDIANEPGTAEGVKIHLNNDMGTFSQLFLSTDRGVYLLNSMDDTVTLPTEIPYTSDHKLLLQLSNSEGRFYRFCTIDNLEELTIDLTSINTPEQMKSISFPAAMNVSYNILARAKVNDTRNEYFLSSGWKENNADKLDIYYPGEYFAFYHTDISMQTKTGDKLYLNNYLGEVPGSFDSLLADAEIVNSAPGNFSVNLSGEFDFYNVGYYSSNHTVRLQVYAPVDQEAWKLPDLTTVFENSDFNFDNFTLNEVLLMDYEGIDWSNTYYDLSLDVSELYAEHGSRQLWIYNQDKK